MIGQDWKSRCLIRFDKRNELIEFVAFGRTGFRIKKRFDAGQCSLVVHIYHDRLLQGRQKVAVILMC